MKWLAVRDEFRNWLAIRSGQSRSADTGSVEAARHAGTAHAMSVDRITTPVIVLHAVESAGLVLNSSDSSHRVPSAAMPAPSSSPSAVKRNACPKTSR